MPGCNAQAAVTDAQIVIAAEIVDEGNDARQLVSITRTARRAARGREHAGGRRRDR